MDSTEEHNMKLGTQTGSLVNHIQSNMVNRPAPEVGMGVTFCHWTDRSAGTIQKVYKDKQGRTVIEVTADEAKRVDNNGPFTEMQTYEFIQKPDGHRTSWREQAGKFVQIAFNEETGRWRVHKGNSIGVGHRDEYRDPCF